MNLTTLPCFVSNEVNKIVFKALDHSEFLDRVTGTLEDYNSIYPRLALPALFMKSGRLSVLAKLASLMRIDTKMLTAVVENDKIMESILKSIVFFYSKPGNDKSCQLTSFDAMMLLEIHAMGGGMREWVDGVSLSGIYMSPLGEELGRTDVKCDLSNLVKDGRFWRRPELLRALAKDINLVHTRLIAFNEDMYNQAVLQQDAYRARVMATSAIVDEVAAIATFAAAKEMLPHMTIKDNLFVGLTEIRTSLDVAAMANILRPKMFEIKFADKIYAAPESFGDIAVVLPSNPLAKRKAAGVVQDAPEEQAKKLAAEVVQIAPEQQDRR